MNATSTHLVLFSLPDGRVSIRPGTGRDHRMDSGSPVLVFKSLVEEGLLPQR